MCVILCSVRLQHGNKRKCICTKYKKSLPVPVATVLYPDYISKLQMSNLCLLFHRSHTLSAIENVKIKQKRENLYFKPLSMAACARHSE